MTDALEQKHVVDWRKLWAEVLNATDVPAEQAPIHALCWGLEQLFDAGVERERALVFVNFVWSVFERELGAVDAAPVPEQAGPSAPAPNERPGGRAKTASEWDDAARKYERLLKEQAHAAIDAYERFCRLVATVGERFGDSRGWLVNVVGWAMHRLYQRGMPAAEVGGLVEETWNEVERRRQARAVLPSTSLVTPGGRRRSAIPPQVVENARRGKR